jgi:4-phospho-D-threonate 3-dehydrogenase / 4-phospho-D-erythronate 3-dehydrogenase
VKKRPAIGLTMGDPAGVGPELCLRALVDPGVLDLCHPVIFGQLDILQLVSRATGLPMPESFVVLDNMTGASPTGPSVVNCSSLGATRIVPGKVSAECGAAAFDFIRTSIEAASAGWIDGVVTAPVHKEAVRLAGVSQPGHTEIFTELTNSERTCMMLCSDVLTVSMATTHIGYFEVPAQLGVQRILDVIELTADALALMNGGKPRLAICGLNPHAGEHGLFGQREEERFVEPAVKAARDRGIAIEGPLPPDTAFTTEQRKLGLPIVRTSVDHGTAFDIAWQGVARPISLFKAVEYAVHLASTRRAQTHLA